MSKNKTHISSRSSRTVKSQKIHLKTVMINYVTEITKHLKFINMLTLIITLFLNYAKEMKYVTHELNRLFEIEQSQCKSLSLVLTITKGD